MKENLKKNKNEHNIIQDELSENDNLPQNSVDLNKENCNLIEKLLGKELKDNDIDINELVLSLNLDKPRTSYHYYMNEVIQREKITLTDFSKQYSLKWKDLTQEHKLKYDQMAQADKIRYNQHLSLVKTYIIDKPFNENVTAFRIFLHEKIRIAIERNKDIKEARNDALAEWLKLDEALKEKWNKKKEEHLILLEKLKKKNKPAMSSYSIFLKHLKLAEPSLSFKQIAQKWKEADLDIKEKYKQLAEEEKHLKDKFKELHCIYFGLKPKAPLSPFAFYLMELAKLRNLPLFEEDGRINLTEAANNWKSLSLEEKVKYKQMFKKQQLAYVMKKTEFKQQGRLGFLVKKPRTAFEIFSEENLNLLKKNCLNDRSSFDFLYGIWVKLSDRAKRKFKKMALEEKERLIKEKKDQVRASNFKQQANNNTSRALSGYVVYLKERFEKVKGTEYKVNLLVKDIAKEWREMCFEEKERYNELAKGDKEVEKQDTNKFDVEKINTLSLKKSVYKEKCIEAEDEQDFKSSKIHTSLIRKPCSKPHLEIVSKRKQINI